MGTPALGPNATSPVGRHVPGALVGASQFVSTKTFRHCEIVRGTDILQLLKHVCTRTAPTSNLEPPKGRTVACRTWPRRQSSDAPRERSVPRETRVPAGYEAKSTAENSATKSTASSGPLRPTSHRRTPSKLASIPTSSPPYPTAQARTHRGRRRRPRSLERHRPTTGLSTVENPSGRHPGTLFPLGPGAPARTDLHDPDRGRGAITRISGPPCHPVTLIVRGTRSPAVFGGSAT